MMMASRFINEADSSQMPRLGFAFVKAVRQYSIKSHAQRTGGQCKENISYVKPR